MYVLFQQLVRELQRNAAVQPYNIDPEQVIARIEMLPSGYRPESGPLPRDTLYLCEHWQFKHFDPRAELPPIVCVVEANADTNAVLFQNRSVAVVYGSTLVDVLLALTNAAYDLGCKSSLITELSRSFLRCRTMDELMLEGFRALKKPLIVADRSQKILYCTSPDLISSPIYRNALASEYIPVGHPFADTLNTSWNASDAPFLTPRGEDGLPAILCKPLTVGTATIGYLHVLAFDSEFGEQDADIAELLGNLLAVILWRTRRSDPRSPQSRQERFLRDVLDNLLGDPEATLERQQEQGITFQPHLYALVFNLRRTDLSDRNRILFSDLAALAHSALPGCIAFLYKNSVFALVESAAPIPDMAAFLSPVMPTVRNYDLSLGVSNEFSSVLSLREAGYQARKALQLGEALDPDAACYLYQDYSLHYMMELALKNESMSAFCPPQLQKLIDYTQKNGPELLDTLRVYLRCGRSKAETAKKLFVHVNTMKYRIAQIQEITGLDLSDDETALELLLAFKMVEYRKKFQHYEPIINS